MIIQAGGPCFCKPGRYVRFVIPPGVPGCEAMVSCRAYDAARDGVVEHGLPANAEIQIRVPNLTGVA